MPFLTRTLAPFEVLGEEGLSIIEHNADTILEEVGIEFRGDPDALGCCATPAPTSRASASGSRAGCAARSSRPRAPRQFTQYARNEANNVEIGGMHTVFAPNYGSPFVRDLDRGRRYGTIEDFRNFVKLAYMTPAPAPQRRDGLRAGRRAGQQAPPRHGLFAHPLQRQAVHGLGDGARAGPRHGRDGAAACSAPTTSRTTAVILSLINANSPLVWDSTMLGAARAYAEANQATLMTPFILAGRDGAGDRGRRGRPDPRRGARRDDVRAARPARARRSSSGRSRARCRCSRARRRSGRRSPRSSST